MTNMKINDTVIAEVRAVERVSWDEENQAYQSPYAWSIQYREHGSHDWYPIILQKRFVGGPKDGQVSYVVRH